MKIVIQIQDLEARGTRWKYAGGSTYVMRDLTIEQVELYDSVYFKEFLENRFNASYTGKLPTKEYEMQSYIYSIEVLQDDEEETEEWKVPFELIVRDRNVGGILTKELFCHRFYPRQDYWSTDPKYKDVIGYVEQHYITPKNHLEEYAKQYITKGMEHTVLNDFIHRDFSRKAYDRYADMDIEAS